MCDSCVTKGRLNSCKLTRGVLNHEQAAIEPMAYPASILNMGHSTELISNEIFLGTVLKGTLREDNNAMRIITGATNCLSFAFF